MMKSGFVLNVIDSDQRKGLPQPPFEKPVPGEGILFDLPAPDKSVVTKLHIFDCIAERQSRRKFTKDPLTLPELSYLLWACQGVKNVIPGRAFRTVPSAGCRHPFDTYVAVSKVAGLEPGLYRYVAMSHKLLLLKSASDVVARVEGVTAAARWIREAALVLMWAVTPYRSEWRYDTEAQRVMLIDVGHACQNLYLAAESIGCGTCAIGAFKQTDADALCGLDGYEEFMLYYAPVGRV